MIYNPAHNFAVFDLATTTGWAQIAAGVLTSGSVDFHRYQGSKSKPADHLGQHFLSFHSFLRDFIRENKPKAIGYERAAFFRSAAANDVCIGLRGILLMQAAAYDIPVFCESIASIKLHWTGSGRAEKPAMIAECIRRTGITPADDNEADAIAMAHLHLYRITTREEELPSAALPAPKTGSRAKGGDLILA